MPYLPVSQKNEYSLTALSAALFELMRVRPVDEISVTELCEKAQVARKTFYRNCAGKMDLVEYLCEKHIQNLLEGVDFSSEDYRMMYRNFFLFWKEQRGFLSVLQRQGLFSVFCGKFIDCSEQRENYKFLDDFLSGKENQDRLRAYHHAFLLGGLCRMLERWTKEDFKTPVEELVSVLCYLVPEHRDDAGKDGM